MTMNGFVFDEASGMYYDHKSGYYYDAVRQCSTFVFRCSRTTLHA